MKTIISSVFIRHEQETQPAWVCESRPCLTNLISIYEQLTCLVDEGKAVDIVYLDVGKGFDTASCGIHLESCQ